MWHRWRRWKARGRALRIGRITRTRAKALASLEPVNTDRFQWTHDDTVSTNGTAITQRIRLNATQATKKERAEWTPRRELGVLGWE